MASNPVNTGTLIGRLAGDPKVFTNADGSRKVLFTVFADRNYTDRNNERISDSIPVEAFVSNRASSVGPYAHIHKGDLVALQTTLQHQKWTDKTTGSDRYETKVVVEDMKFLESKQVTQTRMAERVATLEQQNAAQAAAPAPAPAAAPAGQEQAAMLDEPAFG